MCTVCTVCGTVSAVRPHRASASPSSTNPAQQGGELELSMETQSVIADIWHIQPTACWRAGMPTEPHLWVLTRGRPTRCIHLHNIGKWGSASSEWDESGLGQQGWPGVLAPNPKVGAEFAKQK